MVIVLVPPPGYSASASSRPPVVIDKRGEVGVGARRRTAFELKRALSGQVSKLIEELNEALKILSDTSERDLVEIGGSSYSGRTQASFCRNSIKSSIDPIAISGARKFCECAINQGSCVLVAGSSAASIQ